MKGKAGQRGKRGSRSRRSRRRNTNRAGNSNLVGIPIPNRFVWYAYDMHPGNNRDKCLGQIFFQFNINALCNRYSYGFDEVMVTHITITYRSRLSADTSGNYVMMMLDNGGPKVQSNASWNEALYKKVAAYPGAKVRKVTQNCTVTWRHTEAGDRNFFAVTDQNHYVCTLIWVRDYADSSTVVDGEFDIHVKARYRSGIARNFNSAHTLARTLSEGGALVRNLSDLELGEIDDEVVVN